MLGAMLLHGVLIPGAASLLLAVAAGLGAGGNGTPRLLPGALALAGAFGTAFLADFGGDGLLDAPASWQWLFWAAAGALLLAFLRGAARAPWSLALVCGVLAAVFLRLTMARLVPREFGAAAALAWSAGGGAVAALSAGWLEGAARAVAPRVLAPAWCVWSGGCALLLLELGNARLGEMAGFLAAGAGALALLAWLRPVPPWLHGGGAALAVLLVLLGANAALFGAPGSVLPLALAGTAPLLLRAAAGWAARRPTRPLRDIALFVLIAALPLAAAFAVALAGAGAGGDLPY